ncbi:MAG: hypothetical protein U0P46_03475 [Holophagaceae bacterium]
MAAKQSRLSTIGKIAQDILSIAGVLGLLWGLYNFWDKPFENIKPAETVIRPIHEVLSSKLIKYTDGTGALYRLMGFEIKNEKDVSDLRIKISGISFIEKWQLNSDKITPEDAVNLISKLPTGLVNGKEIYIDMPRIMAKGDTYLHFYASTPPEFKPSSEWFHASSSATTVQHGMYPEYLYLREYNLNLASPDFYKIAFWFLAIPMLVLLVSIRRIKAYKKSNRITEPDGQ